MSNKLSTYIRYHWRPIINIISIVAMLLVIYALQDEIGKTLRNLKNINYWVLLLIIPLQLLNYDSYARMYRALLNYLGQPVAYRSMFRVSLELNFVNNAFPSGGISGISFFGLRLRSYGVKAGSATLVQLLKFFMIFISFQVLIAVGLLILAIGDKAHDAALLIAGTLCTLTLVGTLVAIYIVSSQARIDAFFTFLTKGLNRLIHVVRPHHPETINIGKLKGGLRDMHDAYAAIKGSPAVLKSVFCYALLANVCELLTLYAVYVAFGEWVNIGAVILAYAVANFAGLISVLPGGIGIYESLMLGVLAAAGVPIKLSLPVIVTFRVLTMALKLLPGWYLYHRALQEKHGG
jgi:putative heme transporter